MTISASDKFSQKVKGRAVSLSRDKADTLLLLFACVLVLLPHAANVEWWVSACCAALLIWRAGLTLRGQRMPPSLILIPIASLLMTGVYLSFHSFFGRGPGVSMLALLLTCKLLEMRAKRDLFVVIYLSYFLLLTSFFSSQTIPTAALALLSVATLLTAQLSFQYTNLVPSLWQRIKLGATILGLAIPLTITAFYLFPRIQGPLWGMPSDVNKGRTGLSESMAPGNISDLAKSDDIAFRVKFLDLKPFASPPKAMLYWRGIVLSTFDGRTWGRDANVPTMLPNSSESAGTMLVRQQILLEPSNQRWLLALDVPHAAPSLSTDETRLAENGEIRSAKPIVSRVRYDVSSVITQRFNPVSNNVQATLHDALLLPVGFNPLTLAFASRLRASVGGDEAVIQEVLRMFHEQNFSYTLEPPLLGRHSVDDFLFSTRAGFCEHYASAFVVLMRATHIPARVVTGYQGGAMNSVDGFVEVRQSDAHAWAEVWLQGQGWVRIDPTAAVAPERVARDLRATQPQSAIDGLVTLALGTNSPWTKLRMRIDAINNFWNQSVLNYTQEKQLNLLHSLGFKNVDWSALTIAFTVIAAIIMSAIALPLLRDRPQISPLDRLYFLLCKKLARRAPARAAHESPGMFRERLRAQITTEQFQPTSEFLLLYEQAKYAPDVISHAKIIPRLKSLLARCL